MNRKRKCCTLIFLVVMMLSMDIAEARRVRFSTLKAMQTIKSATAKSGKPIGTKLDKVKNLLEKGDEHSEAVSSAIDSMGSSIGSVMSGNVLDIVTGVMDMVSTIASLIPTGGPIVSAVFSVISGIIGLIGGGSDDMGTIVKKVIDTALANYDDSNLKARAAGTARLYRNSQAYLRATAGQELKTHEVAALVSNVKIDNGVSFLGILKSKVEGNVISKDLVQVRRAMEYTQLYVILATLRSAVLWQLYATLRTAAHSTHTTNGIKAVAMAEEKSDKAFIRYLETPHYNQAIFFASLTMSKWPVVSTYMKANGMKFQDLSYLSNSKQTLRPQKWTNTYMMMNKYFIGRIIGSKNPGSSGRFYFDKLGDNYFHLRPQRYPSWYVFMSDFSDSHCRGWGGKPGNKGEWKVVKFSDGKYMLSPRRWLNYFFYMKNVPEGYVNGHKGDPGIQGHWLINKA